MIGRIVLILYLPSMIRRRNFSDSPKAPMSRRRSIFRKLPARFYELSQERIARRRRRSSSRDLYLLGDCLPFIYLSLLLFTRFDFVSARRMKPPRQLMHIAYIHRSSRVYTYISAVVPCSSRVLLAFSLSGILSDVVHGNDD
jgi:hypothetical protein